MSSANLLCPPQKKVGVQCCPDTWGKANEQAGSSSVLTRGAENKNSGPETIPPTCRVSSHTCLTGRKKGAWKSAALGGGGEWERGLPRPLLIHWAPGSSSEPQNSLKQQQHRTLTKGRAKLHCHFCSLPESLLAPQLSLTLTQNFLKLQQVTHQEPM